MRIAIIGTGIAGNTAAERLHGRHELTVFEACDHVGGHTNTVMVPTAAGDVAVDTGFIVFNEERYPNFSGMLRRLGVATHASDMSFSVRVDATGLEYSSRDLLARSDNLLRPSFLRMLADAARFNTLARPRLTSADPTLTLGAFLQKHRYSRSFVEEFLIPMGGSIWSSGAADVRAMPASFFAQFISNHRFLDLRNQPSWRVVTGGSRRYVSALTKGFTDRIRLSTPALAVRRFDDRVEVTSARGAESFDEVVVATHGDQALKLLTDPTDDERRILSAFRFQENEAVLHTDVSHMPVRKSSWASWNARTKVDPSARVVLTYDMNRLQSLTGDTTYLVTLNDTASIDPSKIIRTVQYRHPLFSVEAVLAQARHAAISGVRRTHFAGAYWGYGFHEDGISSGLRVAHHFEERGR